MSGYQLTQAEWDVYVSNVTGDKIERGKENAYANMPMLFSTLRQEAADAIGEDVKLMVTDKQIIHANRTRINEDGSIADINFSLRDMKRLPKNVANPEAIYKDMETQNWVFRYRIDEKEDAHVVFIPGREHAAMTLHTFYREARGSLADQDRYESRYPEPEE